MRRVLVLLVMGGVATAQPAAQEPPQPTPVESSPDQPPPPPPTTLAEIAFSQGRALLDSGKFAEACSKFEASLRGDPNAPGTLLNLGLCNERLGKTATALGWFRKAQLRSAETGMTDYEDVAKQSSFSLAVRVPTIKVEFSNPPAPGSTVYVDSRQIPDLELSKVEIDPGTHVVELRTQGKPPIGTELTIKDGEQNRVVTIAVPPPPVPRKETIEIDRGASRRLVAYVVGGGGVLLWGGSLAVSLVAKSERESSEHPEDWHQAKGLARWGGSSLFVLGTAALVGAGYLYVTAPDVERVERSTVVTPVVGGDQLGVAVHGAF